MPNLASSKKANRQAQTRRARNRSQLTTLRSAMKKVQGAADAAEVEAAYRTATRLLDRAASRHLIHRNEAARRKARLLKLVRTKVGSGVA